MGTCARIYARCHSAFGYSLHWLTLTTLSLSHLDGAEIGLLKKILGDFVRQFLNSFVATDVTVRELTDWHPLRLIRMSCGVNQVSGESSRSSQPKKNVANVAATNWTATKATTCAGLIPANVSENPRAIVTAGFAKDVDDVNQ